MVTVDADAISQVLGAVDLRVGVGRRMSLASGTLLPIPTGAITLVYIVEGGVQGHPPLGDGCRLDVDRDSHRLMVDPSSRRDVLVAGDAFLTLGRTPFALEAQGDTSLMIAEIVLADAASPLPALLPPFLTVTGFDDIEPAAAALALNMGLVDHTVLPARQGDPVICRMMATTVLLSVIRAWAANGCAPAGWPSLSNDPFLDRVVDAIHEEPGRDWTVERLASIGAMSRSTFAERFRNAVGRSPRGLRHRGARGRGQADARGRTQCLGDLPRAGLRLGRGVQPGVPPPHRADPHVVADGQPDPRLRLTPSRPSPPVTGTLVRRGC